MSDAVRVLVVDDQEEIRTAVAALLAESDDITVVASAATGAEGVSAAAGTSPDVILMDLRMPEMDGVEATRRIVEADPDARVLVHSAYGDESLVLDAFQAGARGYVLKGAGGSDLLRAVRHVAAGQAVVSDEITRPIVERLVVALGQERQTRLAAEEAARKLAELSARQQEFAAMAAHELRTPVTVLIGNLELIAGAGVSREDAATMARSALGAAQRLRWLLENLEVLSSGGDLQLRVLAEEVPVEDAVWRVIRSLGLAGVAPECEIAPGTAVYADPERIEQVLHNVLSNAVLYSPRTAPVRVRAARSHDRVDIEVSDRGPGFSPEMLDHLYEPFVLRDRPAGGLGIGLAVAHDLVTRMGGELAATNDPDGGATVRITLPAAA